MDEKILGILECVRETAAAAGNAVADAACDISSRAMELVMAGRRNVRMAELESSVLTELRHVGEMIYATHTGNPTESEVLLAKLREIDALYDEIDALKREAAITKGNPVCGACGGVGEKGDVYCRDCGRQL